MYVNSGFGEELFYFAVPNTISDNKSIFWQDIYRQCGILVVKIIKK